MANQGYNITGGIEDPVVRILTETMPAEVEITLLLRLDHTNPSTTQKDRATNHTGILGRKTVFTDPELLVTLRSMFDFFVN